MSSSTPRGASRRRADYTAPRGLRMRPRTSRLDAKTSAALDPGLRLVEGAEIAPHLELGRLGPHLGLVDLAVLGVCDRAVLVAVAAGAQVLDDHEAHDRLVLVRPRALGAGLRLALLVVRLGEP